jgi:hypothetical protein
MATPIAQRVIIRCAGSHSPLRRGFQSFAQKTAVLCVEDYSPLRRGLPVFARSLRDCRAIVAWSSRDCRTIVAWLSNRRRCGRLRSRKNSAALRFYAHIHRPYSARRPHPQSSIFFSLFPLPSLLSLPYYLFSINFFRPRIDVNQP